MPKHTFIDHMYWENTLYQVEIYINNSYFTLAGTFEQPEDAEDFQKFLEKNLPAFSSSDFRIKQVRTTETWAYNNSERAN